MAERFVAKVAILTVLSLGSPSLGRAQQQFLEPGRYVSNRLLCKLSDEQLLKRYGDQIVFHAMEINGLQISFYETSCSVTSYARRGDAIVASASCDSEGTPIKRKLQFVRVSSEAFRFQNHNYRRCKELTSKTDPTVLQNRTVKCSSAFSNATRRKLSDLYSRHLIKNFDRNINWEDPPFVVAEVRLKQRSLGNPDLIVLWRDALFCGSSGCRMDVWLWDGDKYQGGLEVNATHVEIREVISAGVVDLLVDGNLFRWSGKKYERP